MQITKVTVGFGSTINLGNYNSARFDVQLEAELDEGEDVEQAVQQLHQQARDNVRRQALPIIRRNSERLEDIFRHLPEYLQQDILQKVGTS